MAVDLEMMREDNSYILQDEESAKNRLQPKMDYRLKERANQK